MPMNKNFSELLAKFQNTTNQVVSSFQNLTPNQINWKPSANEWSVGQCIDHLIVTNSCYFPVLEKVLNGEKKTFWEKLPFLPNFFGNMLLGFLEDDKKKLKAPKAFEPSQSSVDTDVISKLRESQTKLEKLIQKTSHLELDKTIITSPVSPIVTYSLLHAYNILTTHDNRHFEQALRVYKLTNFPRNQP
ncbi:MAG: DinB family protein [Acidobacteria bacterium]|nr:DinB family protein [Acidobacteriota bacterium]